jgi:hypothetical protein
VLQIWDFESTRYWAPIPIKFGDRGKDRWCKMFKSVTYEASFWAEKQTRCVSLERIVVDYGAERIKESKAILGEGEVV